MPTQNTCPGRRRSHLKVFTSDARGGVAIMFGIALVPLVLAGGMALDYARAYSLRTAMRVAADGAALQAARQMLDETTAGEARASASAFARAVLAERQIDGLDIIVTRIERGARVDIRGTKSTTLLAIAGQKTFDLSVSAEAEVVADATGAGSEDIALALDVSGSMASDMNVLRTAAINFIEAAMDGKRRVAVVPFVAAVNVGPRNLNLGYMDTNADGKWHGDRFKNVNFAINPSCTPPASPGGGGGPSVPSGPGNGKRGALPETPSARFAATIGELFGITRAMADVTPRTQPVVPGSDRPVTAPWAPAGSTYFEPLGWTRTDGCTTLNPPKVSHFDLFARIPGAKWKGCVEARPDPYDVTDEPPSRSASDTLFVPYFAPDDPGDGKDPANPKPVDGVTYSNDYLPDTTYIADGTSHPAGPGEDYPIRGFSYYWAASKVANILKYDGVTVPVAAALKETPPLTFGPNRACPDEMLRLTASKSAAKSKIANLSHWLGGGTVGSEGVAWAWRALSPNAPFGDGTPYAPANRKSIILMTDGLNLLDSNGRSAAGDYNSSVIYSDWSAYGFVRYHNGRMPGPNSETFEGATEFLNTRMAAVCANAKAKGVTIYAILFRETDPRAVNTVRNCATEGKFFFQAASSGELRSAFRSIAEGFTSPLRLTR